MRLNNISRFTGVAMATVLFAGTAHALLFRAYLAPTGSDGNPCTVAAPCRLLPAALAAVADGGEIWMLDSANYNTATVSITKSVGILAVPGVVGSVVAMGGPAITIGTAGVKVALRNLVIVPLPGGGGTSGVVMTDGAALTIENCLIANLTGNGIDVTGASVQVTGTTIRNNGSDGLSLWNGAKGIVAHATITGNSNIGISLQSATATSTTADIADSTIGANGIAGVSAWSNSVSAVVAVSVRDSQIVRNASYGLTAQSNFAGSVTLSASNNIISQNNTGIAASGSGVKVWASANTVSDNTLGFFNFQGVFESAGNNAVRNNVTNKNGTITVVAME